MGKLWVLESGDCIPKPTRVSSVCGHWHSMLWVSALFLTLQSSFSWNCGQPEALNVSVSEEAWLSLDIGLTQSQGLSTWASTWSHLSLWLRITRGNPKFLSGFLLPTPPSSMGHFWVFLFSSFELCVDFPGLRWGLNLIYPITYMNPIHPHPLSFLKLNYNVA